MRKGNFVLGLAIVMACCILLSACDDSSKQINSYTITIPYVYPVTPETDDWNSLSMDEKIALSHVDTNVVKSMTTEAVLITTLNYPFIINIFAYGKADEGIDVVKGYCSPLAELLERDDALQVISSYLDEMADAESVEYHIADDLRKYINNLMSE